MLFLVVHRCPDQVEYKEDGKDKDGEAANVAEANASARRNKEPPIPIRMVEKPKIQFEKFSIACSAANLLVITTAKADK